jgi:hypothetical protein
MNEHKFQNQHEKVRIVHLGLSFAMMNCICCHVASFCLRKPGIESGSVGMHACSLLAHVCKLEWGNNAI